MLFGFVALAAMLFITSCDTAGGSEKPGYRGDMGADVPTAEWIAPSFEKGKIVEYRGNTITYDSGVKVKETYMFLFETAVKGKVVISSALDFKDRTDVDERKIYDLLNFDYDTATGRITSTTDKGTLFFTQLKLDEENAYRYPNPELGIIFVAETDEFGLYQTFYPLVAGTNAYFKFKTPKKVDFFNGEEVLECVYTNTDGHIEITKKGYEGTINLTFYDNGTLLYSNGLTTPRFEGAAGYEDTYSPSFGFSTNFKASETDEGVNYLEKFFNEDIKFTDYVKTIPLYFGRAEGPANLTAIAKVIKAHPEYNFELKVTNYITDENDEITRKVVASCFEGINNLVEVTLPEYECNTIGEAAFKDCKNLKIVRWMTTVNGSANKYLEIEKEAFLGCDALESLYLNSGKPWMVKYSSKVIQEAGEKLEKEFAEKAKKEPYALEYWEYVR